jgi:selenoprotein W-related protein
LTSKLLSRYKQQIQEMKLVPSSGGCFELSLNGDLVFSKLKAGKFPDEQWVLDTVGSHLKA